MKKIILILYIGVSICSCVNSDIAKETTEINFSEVTSLRNVIDSIAYVSLDTEQCGYINKISKMMSRGDTIFILDNKKSLKAFDASGKYLFSVGQRGRGHGEYLEIRNFTIDEHNLYTIDNYTKKIGVYNLNNGKFITKKNISIVADDIAILAEGNFMFFAPIPLEGTKLDSNQKKYKIFITDNNFEVIDELFEYSEEDCDILSTTSAFTESQQKIVFTHAASDHVIIFDKNDYTKNDCFFLDFGSSKASSIDKHNHESLIKKKYNDSPVFLIDNYMIGDINEPEQPYGAFAYSINNKKVFQNDEIKKVQNKIIPADKFVLSVRGVVKNNIVSAIDNYDWYNELVERGFPVASKDFEQKLQNGEMLLVNYSLL